jgi:hypothetical protein
LHVAEQHLRGFSAFVETSVVESLVLEMALDDCYNRVRKVQDAARKEPR